jgi:hypothetical protein
MARKLIPVAFSMHAAHGAKRGSLRPYPSISPEKEGGFFELTAFLAFLVFISENDIKIFCRNHELSNISPRDTLSSTKELGRGREPPEFRTSQRKLSFIPTMTV